MRVLPFAPVLLLALAACGGTSAGHHDSGTGGTGGAPFGTDPDGAFGGAPGVPVELSFVSWEIRSQTWSVALAAVPSLPAYALHLREEAGGCRGYEDVRFGPRPHELLVILDEPTVGECPMDTGRTSGCRSSIVFVPGSGRGLSLFQFGASSGTVRIDRFEAGVLRGEVRASFPVDPESPAGSGSSTSEGSWMYCADRSGAVRRCVIERPGQDCCNEGKPLEELVVPFEATFCAAEVHHWEPESEAALRAAAACPPAEVDCTAACGAFASTCGTCADCGDDEWCWHYAALYCEEDIAACPGECAAARQQPLASTGMACLAAGAACGEWLPCLSSCGGDQ